MKPDTEIHGGTNRLHHPPRKRHRLSLDEYCQVDCSYFFTICVADRAAMPFGDAVVAERVVEALCRTQAMHDWTLHCYCLMPDHLHLIAQLPHRPPKIVNAGVRGPVSRGILEHVGEFKSYTTSQVWWKLGHAGRLWQKSSYDAVIRYNQPIDVVVRYVLNNPVRAGLVCDWRDYAYSGCIQPP